MNKKKVNIWKVTEWKAPSNDQRHHLNQDILFNFDQPNFAFFLFHHFILLFVQKEAIFIRPTIINDTSRITRNIIRNPSLSLQVDWQKEDGGDDNQCAVSSLF